MKIMLPTLLLLSLLFLAPRAFAGHACSANSGCTSGGVSIESDIVNPTTNSDVSDVNQNILLLPGQTVTFHITVHNNGTDTINSATITDIFPQNLTVVSAPATMNPNTRQITFAIGNLDPGTSQTFTITGTVDGSNLATNQPTCAANIAYVNVGTESVQDTSNFCMQANGQTAAVVAANNPTPTPVTPALIQSPETGPGNFVWIGILGAGISGCVFKKLGNKTRT